MKFLLFNLCVLLFLQICETARILCVFSVPYYSHQTVLKILPEELAKFGHQIVVMTPEPNKTPTENITQIDTKETAAEKWEKAIQAVVLTDSFAVGPVEFLVTAMKTIIPITDAQFSIKEVQDLIKGDAEFDLIIAEDCTRVSALIGARFKAPIVLVSSFFCLDESFSLVQSETNPILFPFFQKRPETFWERMRTFLRLVKINLALRLDGEYNALIRKNFGEDASRVDKVRKHVKVLLLSVNHMWDNNRATTPSVTYMGAIHVKEARPLPESFNDDNFLGHTSIKAFITHGGLQSTDEAIAAGVPLIGLPIMADQHQNVQKYREYGIGVELDIDNLDEEEFRKEIVEVVEDRRYRDNIKRLRDITWDQPTRGLNRAVSQIHRLLAHGPYPTDDVTAFEYYAIDVCCLVITILIASCTVILLALRLIMKYLDLDNAVGSVSVCFTKSFIGIFAIFLNVQRVIKIRDQAFKND